MATAEWQGVRVEELAEALRSVDPRIALVPPRVLRRVVKGVVDHGQFAWNVPHLEGFAAPGSSVLLYTDRDEVGLDPDDAVPAWMILLAEPDARDIEDRSREDVFLRYWRQVFHARVHLAFEASPRFSLEDGWPVSRIERLGRIEFAEARQVLVEDGYLVLPADDRSTYIEFAAVFLELAAFHPDRVADTFPAIRDQAAVRALLAADFNPDALLAATRPPGAPAGPILPEPAELDSEDEPESPDHLPPAVRSPGRWARLKARAEAASSRGNNVRAAIVKVIASRIAPAIEGPRTRASARSELDTLSRRLRAALGFESDEATAWRRSLPPLLDRASRGLWPREARLLYDLQKICIDHERPIFAVDLAGWVVTFGRRPLKRVLPDHREVVMLKHLRAAAWRLRAITGPEPARSRLVELLARAIHHQETAIRDRFRDRIRDAFDRVGICPDNLPERAARRKLIEELLDLIVQRGFIRLGDLRDAISRNQMKLRDLSGLVELIRRDPLLRADAELARDLDGVYQRGEIYLRFLQRASSLAFGTRIGRALSLFIALPFGIAFIALEGTQHVVEPIVHAFGGVAPHLFNAFTFASLAVLLVGIINILRFRSGFFRVCRVVGRGLRLAFHDVPRWVLDLPVVRAVVSSRTFTLAWNWIGKPIIPLIVLALISPRYEMPVLVWRLIWMSAFVVLALLINSRSGRDVEEIAADGASRVGQRLWRDVLPNVFRGIMDFFAAGLELVERGIYAVDEWLRFRGGEGRLSLGFKAVIGLVWGIIAYFARIYINLLIEPQINPIKHFPVVTVSHKMMIPMIGEVYKGLSVVLRPLGPQLTKIIAYPSLFLLPGVFGFIAWELKENWRLYAANRPKTLQPVPIGHHGETLCRMLRRGFHSGTVPKLYAKLRSADRRSEEGRGNGPVEKSLRAIEHAGEAVRHLVDRGVVFLLDQSRSIGDLRPGPGEVECATNRIVVELVSGKVHDVPARIAFEETAGRLVARIEEPGWFARLDDEQRRVLTSALAGLYAMSDVDAASEIDLEAFPITWSAWVETWEADAEGRGHVPVVPDDCRLLGVTT